MYTSLTERNLPTTGHKIVATIIAQSRLEPQVLDSVCSILGTEGEGGGDGPCYLSAVALWADGYRRAITPGPPRGTASIPPATTRRINATFQVRKAGRARNMPTSSVLSRTLPPS